MAKLTLKTMDKFNREADMTEQNRLREKYREIVSRYWNGSKRMINYELKTASRLVELENGSIIPIEKPSIQTRFCFGESGYDFDEAQNMVGHASKSQEYFKTKNLEELQAWIDILARRTDGIPPVVYVHTQKEKSTLRIIHRARADILTDADVEINEEDRARASLLTNWNIKPLKSGLIRI